MGGYEIMTAFVTNILFVLILGFYLITNLQWYDYKISRVVLKHHRPLWHLFYFLVPFFLYYINGSFFVVFFYLIYLPSIFLWYRKLDKKLVFTGRVKRFFTLLIFVVFLQDMLCTLKSACGVYGVFIPLFFSLCW